MTRYDLLDIRAALDKASNWAHSQKDLFQMIDAKKKVEAVLNEHSLPGIEENSIPGKDFIPVGWVDACEKYGKWKIVKVEQPEVFDTIAFQKGVREGRRLEREDALTIADIEKLHTFLYAVMNNKRGVFTFTRLSDEQYEEVLRRFNNEKEK